VRFGQCFNRGPTQLALTRDPEAWDIIHTLPSKPPANHRSEMPSCSLGPDQLPWPCLGTPKVAPAESRAYVSKHCKRQLEIPCGESLDYVLYRFGNRLQVSQLSLTLI
jgi:hypothetical protein